MALEDLSLEDIYKCTIKKKNIQDTIELISKKYKFSLTEKQLQEYLNRFDINYQTLKSFGSLFENNPAWKLSFNQLQQKDMQQKVQAEAAKEAERQKEEYTEQDLIQIDESAFDKLATISNMALQHGLETNQKHKRTKQQSEETTEIPDVYEFFKEILKKGQRENFKTKWDSFDNEVKNYLLGKPILKLEDNKIYQLTLDEQKVLLFKVMKTDFMTFINDFVNMITNREVLQQTYLEHFSESKAERMRTVFPNIEKRINQLAYIDQLNTQHENILLSPMYFSQILEYKNKLDAAIKQQNNTKEKTEQLLDLWNNSSTEFKAYLTGKPIRFIDGTIEALDRSEQKAVLLRFISFKLPAFLAIFLKEVTNKSLLVELKEEIGYSSFYNISINHKITARIDELTKGILGNREGLFRPLSSSIHSTSTEDPNVSAAKKRKETEPIDNAPSGEKKQRKIT